eukprot:3616647-Pyramimonas_sp.AAC.1
MLDVGASLCTPASSLGEWSAVSLPYLRLCQDLVERGDGCLNVQEAEHVLDFVSSGLCEAGASAKSEAHKI